MNCKIFPVHMKYKVINILNSPSGIGSRGSSVGSEGYTGSIGSKTESKPEHK